MFELRLLGALEIRATDGRNVEPLVRRSKRTALLAYLAAALPRGCHRRDKLLALFWPESDEAHARAALSQALYVLRSTLGESAVVTRGEGEVGLDVRVVGSDVAAFEAALDGGRAAEALALYRGDLLDGFFVTGSAEFERWLDVERARLRQRASEGAWALAEAKAAEGDAVEAERWARRAGDLLPDDEAVIRRLMTFLHRLSDKAAAIRAYEAFAWRLAQEHELEPSAETQALAAAIRKSLEAVPSLRVVRETVPAGLEEVTTTALAKAPADRFASASHFMEALERGRFSHSRVAPSRRRRLLLGAAVLLFAFSVTWWGLTRPRPASGHISSLAVLPLKNLMGDPEQDYFVEGMHEALTAELSKIGALKVMSRTTAMRYQNTDKTMQQIARELGVDGLIEGSVMREGGQVRITVELIHEPSDRHLWADSYQRDLRGILVLQTDVAREIANQIQATLTPAEKTQLASAPTVNAEAYEAYLRGRYFFNRWPAPEHARCVQQFQQAIKRAPDWADAHAGLAACYTTLSWTYPPKDVLPRARVAAQRALELDPNQAEAYVALGSINLFYDWNWEAAGQSARQALELSPNSASAHLLYSNYSVFLGSFEEAIGEAHQAVELDPASLLMNRNLAFVYQLSRRYPHYAAQARATLDLAPENVTAKFDVAWAYALQGMREEAVAELNLNKEAFSGLPAAVLLATLGQRERALEQLEVAKAERAKAYVDAFWIAVPYAALGEADDALRWLNQAYEERSASMVQLKTNPALDPLRDDARFQDLVRRMNFPN